MQFPKALYRVDYQEKGRSHLYPVTMPDGTVIGPLPSVTRIQSVINKPALVPWAKREALKRAKEEIAKYIEAGQSLDMKALDTLIDLASKEPDKQKDKAADIGTRTHEAIDKWIRGEMPTLEDDEKPGFENFQHWLETEKIRMYLKTKSFFEEEKEYSIQRAKFITRARFLLYQSLKIVPTSK